MQWRMGIPSLLTRNWLFNGLRPMLNSQLSIIHYQLSIINSQLSIIHYQLIKMLDRTKYLSEHLASPNEAALSHSNKFDGLHLSPHFSLGELTKTSFKTEDNNEASVCRSSKFDGFRLSPHFTLGELTKTSFKTGTGWRNCDTSIMCCMYYDPATTISLRRR